MDSYHNHSESNQHYQTSMNNYGFSYNNYDSAYYPGYNSVNSISTSSSNTSPSSIASSPASSTNLNYPLNNFNHLTSPQPYYNQSYSQSFDPSQYTYDSSNYSYSSFNRISQLANSTPNITHYKPTSYTSTYTSTPSLPFTNDLTKNIDFKIKTPMKPKTITLHKSRSKVLKLDMSITNIGFGTLEQVVLPSDISNGTNKSVKTFKCPECTSTFSNAAKLYMHHHKEHQNRSSMECPICCKYKFTFYFLNN